MPATISKRLGLLACGLLLNALLTIGLLHVINPARAVVGIAPTPGFQLVDGVFINGIVNGQNFNAGAGITAHAGGTQALAFQLAPGQYMYQVDTVATTGDSVALPECVQGTAFFIRNAGANLLNVFGNPTTNAISSTLDTINGTAGSTAFTISSNAASPFFCAKSGAWSAMHSSF